MTTTVIYLKRDRERYYVGETKNILQRYSVLGLQNIVATAPASPIKEIREEQEMEAIEFCLAFGLPISNTNIGESGRAIALYRRYGSKGDFDDFLLYGFIVMYNPARFSQEEQRNRARSIHNDS